MDERAIQRKKDRANLGKETRRKIQNCHHIHAEGKKYTTSPTHGNSSPLSPLLEAINFGKHCATTGKTGPKMAGNKWVPAISCVRKEK